MTIGTAVRVVLLEKYATFTGRASRSEYWYFSLASFLVGFAVGFLGGLAQLGHEMTDMLSLFLNLAILIPTIAVGVRRLHDSDKSGWFLLIPFYNLYLLIRKGTTGPNRFGNDPTISVTSV